MFTKIFFSKVDFAFVEDTLSRVPKPVIRSDNTGANDRSLLALSLVFIAHLAVFAALRPQSQLLPVVTPPQVMEVSLVSAPQVKPQQPKPPVQAEQKPQKPVKKTVKPTAAAKKTPVSKPVRVVQHPSHAITTPPVEPVPAPVAATSTPVVPSATSTANKTKAEEPTFQSPSFNAAYLNNPAPAYPPVARRLGEEGRVLLRVQVTADGAAASVELHKSSGSNLLDQAALAAVKKWRFIPAKRGEQTVSASVIVPVSFSIEG